MTGDGREAAHAMRAETLTQLIDERCAPLRSVALVAIRKVGLPCRHRFGARDCKPDGLEAETGILHRRQRFELKLDQPRHMADAARRRRKPDSDGLDRTVDAIEAKPQGARSDVVALER